MKIVILPLSILLSSSLLLAQSSSWDSTHRPNNFLNKVDQFRSYPNASTDIVFLGNSIIAGTDWNELLGFRNAKNRGISGDITFGVLERLQEVTEGQPAKIFILIGINDVSRNIPDSIILDNYKKIIQRIKKSSPLTKIYFSTLLPVNNEFTQFKNHYNKDEHILYINAELKKLAMAEKIILVDPYPSFLNADNKLDKQYTVDGLHLNAAGYKRWASLLKPYLNK
ncbi:MAG TPA: GDSL-type esterase/lipase family protein [Chitinophagaceae bacterium]|nr:GDSL-type esterase/lipase family protein [Chitinophagaceae bacterium]